MTLAVDLGRKATKQTNKQTTIVACFLISICLCTFIAYIENNIHPDQTTFLGAV